MILLDYNQAMLTAITPIYKKLPKNNPEEFRKAIKAAFLERVRSINRKYRGEYGRLVICCESPNTPSWRKGYFQFYKAKRKAARDASQFDWTTIHSVMNEVRDDLGQFFNYPIMAVEGAEGDDVIATLARRFLNAEKRVLIFSGDKDFNQLHRYEGIVQYSPITQKFLKSDKPNRDLKEKIIRGDDGDGVPNILSKDNIFLIEDEKQRSISKIKCNQWLEKEPLEFCTTEDMRRNWIRNRTLIDFDFIPEPLAVSIVTHYEAELNKPSKEKSGLIDYFLDQGLPNFMASLQDY